MKKLAVVTGAKGFIGSNLARDLVNQDMHVVLTDLSSVSPFRIKDILDTSNKACFIPSNILDTISIMSLIGDIQSIVEENRIEQVEFYHSAAYFSYNPHTPYDYYHQINVEGTAKILSTLYASPVLRVMTTFVVWGSATVHGNAENFDAWINKLGGCDMSDKVKFVLKDKLYFKESDQCLPASRYELSKYIQEGTALRLGQEYGLDVRVGRPTGVYGPWSTYAAASAIFMIARGELKGIPGPGTSYASLVHVDDVVDAFQYIARHGTRGEVYNVADDGDYQIGELFTHVANEINKWRKKRSEPLIQFNPNFHLPIPVVMIAAGWLKLTSRITRLQVKIESDLVELFFRPARFSNEKLKGIGYQFKYPDTLKGITQTIAWYAKESWI